MQWFLLLLFRIFSSVLNNNARFIITDHLIFLCHLWRFVQRAAEHSHVVIYIHHLVHRRGTESVAQFCDNKTHCREVPRPSWQHNKQRRLSMQISLSRRQVAEGYHTPLTVPWVGGFREDNYDKPQKQKMANRSDIWGHRVFKKNL